MADYDVIVIGAGPGGYVCAIRCAQLGLKTACVEGRETLGGTCLNIGCIPSKALLHASELYHEAHENFEKMGLSAARRRRSTCRRCRPTSSRPSNSNTKGIEFLFKKNKVDWLKGWGRITAPGEVTVGDTAHKAKSIVIASGSEVTPLRGVTIDEKTIVSSTGALDLPEIPKRLVVIGAGVIGLELGSVYARLGAQVTVLEFLDQITPGMDLEICKALQKLLTKQGLKFVLGAAVQCAEPGGDGVHVTCKLRKDDSEASLDADVVLVATGRRPYVEGLGLDAIGVALTERGQVKVDARWQTSVPGIYAIGDAIAGPMLAHKAEDEGMAVAETIAGQHGHVNYGVIPSVIYTNPEVAAVGETEESLKAPGPRLQGRQVPLHGQRPRQVLLHGRRLRENPRGRRDRPRPRRPHHRPAGRRADRRGLRRHGVRRRRRGHRPHLPRPPDLLRGGPRSRARLRRRRYPRLSGHVNE